MTNEEFSNIFDTMLSSYLHAALFGEQASIADVVLDEYEKSIFLTQALDLIVKSYFEKHLNSNGEGFDDSTRRLLDYSNLITTCSISTLKESQDEAFSENGIILDFSDSVFGITPEGYKKTPLFIINERVISAEVLTSYTKITDNNTITLTDTICLKIGNNYITIAIPNEASLNTIKASAAEYYLKLDTLVKDKNYVIVPLNYKEYDRMMSKAYCEPLKRLAWRLFETDKSALTNSVEIIMRSDAKSFYKYTVRYIRRPRPIVLVDLTDTANNLSIEGVQTITLCELNPIIHNEILLLAVQLALTSKGIETRDMKAARELANKNN